MVLAIISLWLVTTCPWINLLQFQFSGLIEDTVELWPGLWLPHSHWLAHWSMGLLTSVGFIEPFSLRTEIPLITSEWRPNNNNYDLSPSSYLHMFSLLQTTTHRSILSCTYSQYNCPYTPDPPPPLLAVLITRYQTRIEQYKAIHRLPGGCGVVWISKGSVDRGSQLIITQSVRGYHKWSSNINRAIYEWHR